MTAAIGEAPAAPPLTAPFPSAYVEVAVDAPVKSPATFTYSAPPELDLRPGCLVRAPFGHRTLSGVVVGVRDTPGVEHVKAVEALAAPAPLVSPERLALARWMADYYMAPLYDALAMMLPPNLRMRAHTVLRFAA